MQYIGIHWSGMYQMHINSCCFLCERLRANSASMIWDCNRYQFQCIAFNTIQFDSIQFNTRLPICILAFAASWVSQLAASIIWDCNRFD